MAALTLGFIRTVTDTSAPAADRGADDGGPVERRVGPQQRLATRVRADQVGDGLEGVGDQPFRAARRPARSLPQPLRHDHRRRPRGGDRGQQRVQAADPGVAEPGALLGVPVDLDDRVVDVDQHRPCCRSPPASSGGPGGQAGQEPRGDRVELADMPEGERAQERTQRRRRVRAVEQPCPSRRAAAAPCHRCSRRRRPSRPPARPPSTRRWRPCRSARSDAHRPTPQAGRVGQRQHRNQPSRRHQIRVIEHRSPRRAGVRKLHPRDALPGWSDWSRRKSQSPSTAGHLIVTARSHHQDHRWIGA